MADRLSPDEPAPESVVRPSPDAQPTVGCSELETADVAVRGDGPRSALDRWGHFEISQRLGAGAFGEVYRARDTKLDRDVALKLVRVSGGARSPHVAHVLQEARLLARIRHPNVVTVYGADHIEDRVGIWMEFVRGQTLADVVRTQGPFGAREAALIGLDLCAALAAVHGAGLVHGDLKAHNIMREEGGRTLLMDFGAGLDVNLTAASDTIAGTPLYLAPEIFSGEPRTPAIDIYALGVLLYHLVSGGYPVEGPTLPAVAEAHRRGARRLLRDLRADLPESFARVVELAVAREVSDRFATSGALAAELGAFLDGRERGLASPAPAAPPLDAAERHRRTAHLALRPTAHFVGREHDVQRIHEMLQASADRGLTAGRVVAITALGGTGKTTLARMYAERYWSEYAQLLWIDARRGYESELVRLCELVLPDIAANLREMPDGDKARRVLGELEDIKDARLLIVDNAEDEASVTPWLPKTGHVHTLITSRYAHWEAIPVCPLAVLEAPAARALLLTRAGRADPEAVSDDERAACGELAERLGYLPLALEQAAAYIRKQGPGFGCREYLRLLVDAQKALLSLPIRGTTEYPSSVFTTWRTTIEQLPAGARVMLRLSAFMASTEIPLGIFQDSAEELTQLEAEFPDGAPSEANASAEFRVRAWRQALSEYSMITPTTGNRFSVHPLVQAVERDHLSWPERTRWVTAAIAAFVVHAPIGANEFQNWETWRRLSPHAEALHIHAHKLNVIPVSAQLLRGLCLYYDSQGRSAEALPLARELVEQDESALDTAHSGSLSTIAILGGVLRNHGMFAEARQHLELAVQLTRQLLGEEHPDTLRTTRQLADIYRLQGDYPFAEPLFKKVVEIGSRVLGRENPATLASVIALGVMYRSEGRYREAETLFIGALQVQRELLGHEHPTTLHTMSQLAKIYRLQGRYAEAESLLTTAVEVERRLLGDEHPLTLLSVSFLGMLYRSQGLYVQAEPLLTTVLHTERRLRRANDPTVLEATINLAELYRRQGRFADAEPLFTDTLKVERAVLGEEHPFTLLSTSCLAMLYRSRGEYHEAARLFCDVLEIQRRVLGTEHPSALCTANQLAELYRMQGRYEQAEQLLTHVLSVERRTLGEEHPLTLESTAFLGALHWSRGQNRQAESLFIDALDTQRRVLGINHPNTIATVNNLAELYRSQGRHAEAAALVGHASDVRHGVFGPQRPDPAGR